ncbi:uncharacterized protein LOC141612427 [Silene latifolia]|uniref:uncharacterized protein LOC141612427 n=1 Tax=Silene latifolia TaxID=37657 RepID=UPI003D770028
MGTQNMGTQNMLEFALVEILRVVNPLREDLESRMKIIDDLREVVSSIESLKGATVDPFGSFLSQLFSRWGDLDISIELANGSHILVPAKKHKHMLLGDVIKALRKTGSFRRLQFVSHARVPILKLESKVRNISCDISINNLSGHMKSKFILWISLIDRRFREMVLLVKEWAKANGINNPKSGTFNSYSLSLLVIFHFQTCAPAILPPLEDIYPGNMADELIGIRAEVERRMEETAVSNIERFRRRRRANHSSLSELFVSFFGKFLDISTRTTEQGVCTYSGRWENISTNTRWLPRTYTIFIEDPFEQPENTARAVAQSRLKRIAEAFQTTYQLLISPNLTRNSLIPSLVHHQLSGFFPGAAFVFPSADVSPYPQSHQSAPRRNHSSSQHQKTWKNPKGQNGKQLPPGQQVHVANQQLPREKHGSQHQNVDQPKTGSKGENGKQLSPGRQMPVANQYLPRENCGSQRQNMEHPKPDPKGQNGKQSSPGRQEHVANQQLSREDCGSQPQNVDRPKSDSKGQNSKQLSRRRQEHVTNQQLSREKRGSQHQNEDRPKAGSKGSNGKQPSPRRQVHAANQWLPKEDCERQRQNVDRLKTDLIGQNGKQLSPGQVHAAKRRLSREKHGSQHQNGDRPKAGSQGQNGKHLSKGQQVHLANQQPREKCGSQHQNVDQPKTDSKGQNSKQLSPRRQVHLANQQLTKEKCGNQCQNVDQPKTGQAHVPPVPAQVVGPRWPHTLQPNCSK